MRKRLRTPRALPGNRQGTAAVEFALVFPIYILMIMTAIELGLIFYHTVIIENAMLRATREAKIGSSVGDTVREKIQEYSVGIMNRQNLQITNALENIDLEADYSNAEAEPCLSASGERTGQTCPCTGTRRFDDLNSNGICDAGPPPLDTGLPGQVVIYNAIYDWEVISPLTALVMRRSTYTDEEGQAQNRSIFRIRTAGAVRNEPFDE